MGTPFSIRQAAASDVAALRDVYRRSSLSNEGDRALLMTHPELLKWSGLGVRQGRTLVALIAGVVVGFATLSLTPTSADIEDLFVDPDWMHGDSGAP